MIKSAPEAIRINHQEQQMPNQTSSRNHLSQRSRKIVEEIARQRSAEYRLVIRALFRIRFVYTPKHCSWLNQVEM